MNTYILDIICYLGTALTLISYCCRTLMLRVFVISGNVVNIIWALLANQMPIVYSNILYLIINIIGLIREIHVNKTKKKFRSLNPSFDGEFYTYKNFKGKSEKELISILKKEKII